MGPIFQVCTCRWTIWWCWIPIHIIVNSRLFFRKNWKYRIHYITIDQFCNINVSASYMYTFYYLLLTVIINNLYLYLHIFKRRSSEFPYVLRDTLHTYLPSLGILKWLRFIENLTSSIAGSIPFVKFLSLSTVAEVWNHSLASWPPQYRSTIVEWGIGNTLMTTSFSTSRNWSFQSLENCAE